MIGLNELVVAIVVGGIIFLFGAPKVKQWVGAFKDVKTDYEQPTKKVND